MVKGERLKSWGKIIFKEFDDEVWKFLKIYYWLVDKKMSFESEYLEFNNQALELYKEWENQIEKLIEQTASYFCATEPEKNGLIRYTKTNDQKYLSKGIDDGILDEYKKTLLIETYEFILKIFNRYKDNQDIIFIFRRFVIICLDNR